MLAADTVQFEMRLTANRENMMDVATGIDVTALLSPGQGDGAGPDPRADYTPQSLYYRLRDARAEARAAERAADAEGNLEASGTPQWRMIADLAGQLLKTSKDLEIAAWYTESLLRIEGLGGLAAGFHLMIGLVETYWDTLHPLPDEDGIATRVAPVTGLNGQGGDGTLIQPLRKLVLFERPDRSPVSFWQYEQSAEVSAIGDVARREQRLKAGVQSFEELEAQARVSSERFGSLRQAARAAAEAWDALSMALDARTSGDAPPTGRVRDLLAEIVRVTSRYAPDLPPDPVEQSAAAPATTPGDVGPDQPAPPGRLETREEALRRLDEIAAFFRRTEPHSPLAYTLNEAVRRARLPWPELLAEVVPDAGTRAAILTSLGIRPPQE